ncbi:HEAT repeat domain-containing protein [Cellulomonas sp. URHE0023]|uniref:HEAT repeat domain-containing protein n=1 Tax=Cellulomonas sp. URHE0023 TaxID=1380354 RepID=UPI00047FBDF5|nr:HEAT repeat domain-containing protein [Cellulomonas sp. URHE0023]
MELDELRKALDRDELNYPALAARAGPESIENLEALVAEDEPRIASKAAYLAALIDAAGSARVVDLAAQSRHDVVRASAAAALGSLPQEHAAPIADRLLTDPDVGIRARTVRSVASLGLQDSLQKVADEDDHPEVRALAAGLMPG